MVRKANILYLPPTLERSIIERSILIKNMLEDVGEGSMEEEIPIPNVWISSLFAKLYSASPQKQLTPNP